MFTNKYTVQYSDNTYGLNILFIPANKSKTLILPLLFQIM
jgi:hypothetical protein